jgi:hypothetical protein
VDVVGGRDVEDDEAFFSIVADPPASLTSWITKRASSAPSARVTGWPSCSASVATPPANSPPVTLIRALARPIETSRKSGWPAGNELPIETTSDLPSTVRSAAGASPNWIVGPDGTVALRVGVVVACPGWWLFVEAALGAGVGVTGFVGRVKAIGVVLDGVTDVCAELAGATTELGAGVVAAGLLEFPTLAALGVPLEA